MGSLSILAYPFGISTAPGDYQARMAHEILQDHFLNGAIVYIDDTVIYGSTVKAFLSILDQILSRIAAFNVWLKPSKALSECSPSNFWDISSTKMELG